MIKLAIDAMGGDFGVNTTVAGSMMAIEKFKDIEIVLYGDSQKIEPLLSNKQRISVVHTTNYVDMGEKDPVRAIRRNKDASLVLAMNAVKNKEVDGVVTSGPTQCVIVGAHLIIKRLEQMSRVALCPIIPSLDRRGKLLLDVGANVELKPQQIVELAVCASVACKAVLDVSNPVVGLLNIGAEPGKGREVDKETFYLLKDAPNVNFYGNIEPKEMLESPCDVLITDGFTGNMVMKSMEGTAKVMTSILKEEIKSSFFGKLGYLFMKKNLKRFAKRMDANEIGGAMILGINAPVIKAHGSSDPYAFYNGIRQARTMVLNDVTSKINSSLEQLEKENE